MNSNDSFWLVCDQPNHCHCDWRTTIVDCIERKPMFYIYIVNAIWSLLITIIGSALLYHRVINKKQQIFDFNSPFGIRPKPIESMLFFGIVFNALRVIDAVLLITDALPNAIFRAFLYDLPWQFGLCAFACYLFGIAHTVSHSSKVIQNSWFKSSLKIDILCSTMITLPFITNNICSISAAVYAEQGDLFKAKLFTDALYYLWTAYCFILAVFILFAGIRLLKILRHHLEYQHDPEVSTVQKIKNGAFKVKMIMSISVTSLFIFSFIKCMYGLFRVQLLLNNGLNLAIASVWTFDGTLASMLVVMTLLFNPKALTPLSMSSNGGGSSSETYNAAKSQLATANTFNNHNTAYHYTTATDNATHLRESATPMDSSTIVYQGGYPLSNLSTTTDDLIAKDQKNYYSYIVSSNFEHSGISETHLVPSQDTKAYNM